MYSAERIAAAELDWRIDRSTVLLSSSTQPSSMKRVTPASVRERKRMASARLVFWLIKASLARSPGTHPLSAVFYDACSFAERALRVEAKRPIIGGKLQAPSLERGFALEWPVRPCSVLNLNHCLCGLPLAAQLQPSSR